MSPNEERTPRALQVEMVRLLTRLERLARQLAALPAGRRPGMPTWELRSIELQAQTALCLLESEGHDMPDGVWEEGQAGGGDAFVELNLRGSRGLPISPELWERAALAGHPITPENYRPKHWPATQ